jgi:hypothetical protein
MPPGSKKAALLSCLLAAGMAYYYFALFLPYAHAQLETAGITRGYRYGCDLYPFWLTSRQILKDRNNPYTQETTNQIQIGLYGRTLNRPGDPAAKYRAFAYPLYADFLALPVAILPFPIVQAIGSILFPLIVICTCWLWLRFLNLSLTPTSLLSLFALTLASYPVLECLYALQPSLIVALLLSGTAAALARNRLGLAAVLLALASIKPQLVVIVALWLLIWASADSARRRFIYSFFATLVALFFASWLAVPGWLIPWVHSLTAYRQYTDPPLSRLDFGPIAGNLFAITLLAIGAVRAFRSRRAHADSPQFATTFSYLLAITVLIAPSSLAVYDHILLLPAILWLLSSKDAVFKRRAPIGIIGFAAIAALSWQWLAATGVTLYSLVSCEILHGVWITLPLRTAASVPFAIVALWLFLWWKGEKPSDPAKPARSPVRSG